MGIVRRGGERKRRTGEEGGRRWGPWGAWGWVGGGS